MNSTLIVIFVCLVVEAYLVVSFSIHKTIIQDIIQHTIYDWEKSVTEDNCKRVKESFTSKRVLLIQLLGYYILGRSSLAKQINNLNCRKDF